MWRWLFILGLAWAADSSALGAAAEARILKVLPHYLDHESRHTLSPSLYERDAYQAHLRQHPSQQSALRFDVQWKTRSRTRERLTLRVEILSGGSGSASVTTIESQVAAPRFRSRWTSLLLTGQEFQKLGSLGAWRATLWDGSILLAEQKSFLW